MNVKKLQHYYQKIIKLTDRAVVDEADLFGLIEEIYNEGFIAANNRRDFYGGEHGGAGGHVVANGMGEFS